MTVESSLMEFSEKLCLFEFKMLSIVRSTNILYYTKKIQNYANEIVIYHWLNSLIPISEMLKQGEKMDLTMDKIAYKK